MDHGGNVGFKIEIRNNSSALATILRYEIQADRFFRTKRKNSVRMWRWAFGRCLYFRVNILINQGEPLRHM